MRKILFIFGTRPEAIKLAPLIMEFQNSPEDFQVKICNTGQHKDMLDQVLDFFKITSDFNFNLMRPNQSLFSLTEKIVSNLESVLSEYKPDLIFVQGDTTTAFVGALAGFYSQIPIAHVEAGLRSHDIYSPFPEEANRSFISRVAKFHFVPTQMAYENLENEAITTGIHQVGNTVIDALKQGLEIINNTNESEFLEKFNFLDFNQRIILVTGHRRENFGKPFEQICQALIEISQTNPEVQIVFPVHLNPNVQEVCYKLLGDIKNIHLISPLSYPSMVWLLNKSYMIITDSGGLQEEAPTFNKPILVTRNKTERIEGVEAGTAILVGTDKEKIVSNTNKLIQNSSYYQQMSKVENPYGDGTSSIQILKIIKAEL